MTGLRDLVRRGHPASPLRHLNRWREASCGGIRVRYKRHLDGGGTWFGQEFAPHLRSRGMPRQQRIFEWCAGPGFIGFSMLGQGLCDTLCLADISAEAVAACRRTVDENGLHGRVDVYRSDNLKDIPAAEKWNLVVSNPPHFIDDFVGDRRDHDPGWSIHRGFFAAVGRHLAPGGVIVLQENNRGSTPDDFRAMIDDARLSIVFVDRASPQRTADDRFYYIGIVRRGDEVPAWAAG